MKAFRSRWFLLVLLVGMLVTHLPAQVASQSVDNMGPDPQASGSPSTGDATASPAAGQSSEWTGFVIPGVIKLDELSGAGVVFGAGVSEGYGKIDTSLSGNPSGTISVVQPYLGFFDTGARHRVILEYSPTVNLYDQDKFDGSVLERGGVRGFADITKRVRWVFAANATSGTEYLRELSGLGMGLYPGWLTFTVPSQSVFASTATTGIHWRRQPRQEFSFTISDTYSSASNGPHYDAGLARVQMTSYFTRESNWYVFTQANRFSTQPDCTRVEPGLGFVIHLPTKTTVSVEGGPTIAAGSCVVDLTANFGARLVQPITPRAFLELTASRDLIEPYLLQSRWTDTYWARMEFKTTRSTTFLVGSGYARSSDLPGTQLTRYRGFQALSEFNWHLSETIKLVASYRYFKRDFNLESAINPTVNEKNSWVFLSLVWHPASRSIRR